MSIGEIKDLMGLKRGTWTHSKSHGMLVTNMIAGMTDESVIIDVSENPTLKIDMSRYYHYQDFDIIKF